MYGRVLWRFCLFQGFVGVFYRVLDEVVGCLWDFTVPARVLSRVRAEVGES